MTGTERIKERILQDAEADARRCLDEARAQADAILADAAAQCKRATDEAERRLEAAKAAQLQRSEAALQSETRKQALSVRQQLVQGVFEKASDVIVNLPDADYSALLTAMVMQTSWQGNAEIVVSSRDRNRLGDAWLRAIDAQRAAAGLSGTTCFAADLLPRDGGFVVRIGEMEINGTLPVILAGIRPRVEAHVARTLFG